MPSVTVAANLRDLGDDSSASTAAVFSFVSDPPTTSPTTLHDLAIFIRTLKKENSAYRPSWSRNHSAKRFACCIPFRKQTKLTCFNSLEDEMCKNPRRGSYIFDYARPGTPNETLSTTGVEFRFEAGPVSAAAHTSIPVLSASNKTLPPQAVWDPSNTTKDEDMALVARILKVTSVIYAYSDGQILIRQRSIMEWLYLKSS